MLATSRMQSTSVCGRTLGTEKMGRASYCATTMLTLTLLFVVVTRSYWILLGGRGKSGQICCGAQLPGFDRRGTHVVVSNYQLAYRVLRFRTAGPTEVSFPRALRSAESA